MWKRRVFVSAIAGASIAACSDGITSPLKVDHSVRPTSSEVVAGAKHIVYDRTGKAFVLDPASHTLTVGHGRPVVLADGVFSRAVSTFDKINVYDEIIARVQRDPGYLRCIAKGEKLGLTARMLRQKMIRPTQSLSTLGDAIQSIGNGRSSAKLQQGIMRPGKPSYALGDLDDVCTGYALSIKNLTPYYNEAKQEYLDSIDILRDATETAILDPTEFNIAAAEIAAGIAAAAGLIFKDIELQMSVLVDLYQIAGCEDPESGGWGSGGGGGGGAGVTCHLESVVIELSTDGGVTWTEWWSGIATVCE